MTPAHGRLPVAPGVSLYAEVWDGSRRPFVLVHGLSSNCRTWQEVAARLADQGHRVAALDLRGHGRSDQPDDGYDFPTLTADLAAAIDILGYKRPVVAGQSTGGNLAVELARRRPTAVAGVVGVDGGVLELQEQWPEWDECLSALAPPPLAGTAVRSFAQQIREHHADWSEAAVEATLANLEIQPDGTIRPWLTPDRHVRILRALWEHRPSSFLAELDVPILLLLADSGDALMPAKRRPAERAVALAPQARVEWFAGGDHDLHLQRPKEVADSMLGAIAGGFLPP